MDTTTHNREKEIFEQALDLDSSQEQEPFLQKACAGNDALLQRLRALLKANDEEGFLPEAPVNTPAAASAAVTERPGDRIGRYKLLQKIGEGGCGVVYMAEQEEPVRRRVALKVIKLGMDTRSVVARFEVERQALAMMDHPNIARVFDAGATETGRPFFVMELVRGIRMTDYCDEHHLTTSTLTLQPNGNVGIGTTSPGFTLEVNGSAGKPGGGSWSVASDERLKKNIRPLAGALDKLLALHGVSFEYIDPEKIHELSGDRMGLLAQEVEKVFPDWVETGADGYKRVTVRGLEALVVEALRQLRQEQGMKITCVKKENEEQLQEQQKEIAELKNRLSALENITRALNSAKGTAP